MEKVLNYPFLFPDKAQQGSRERVEAGQGLGSREAEGLPGDEMCGEITWVPQTFSLWGLKASHLTCQDLSLYICKVGLLLPALFLREVKRC